MLFIIATPIGNVDDITLRAINTLKDCDYVLSEDTRRTKKLFLHYNIDNTLNSFHDHNKERKTPQIITDLKSGLNIALVSDSGTPGISDPGFYLVRECINNDIDVSPIPGPNSVISALVCSGLPTDKFTFYGFIPKSKSKRNRLFNELNLRNETSILFESPHRIQKTLLELSQLMPKRQIVVARELTKKFEEFIRGKPSDLLKHNIKGEITIIIGSGEAHRH
jgi:16S rRNA (cytidine1402-2'-O)-methyltransferase